MRDLICDVNYVSIVSRGAAIYRLYKAQNVRAPSSGGSRNFQRGRQCIGGTSTVIYRKCKF